ncbi:MAG TPA: thermonuclease family protein [Actinomycetota bacterium]|nr:thermonuclease family protein [Actinomycetota bacterium]
MKRCAVVILLIVSACNTYQVSLGIQAPATRLEEPAGYEVATVTRVVDGDTIEATVIAVEPGPGAGQTEVGQTYDIRLTGIDTPESVKPGTPVECFAKEASAAAKALLEGQEVRLVKDVENTDRYERLLRYVYLQDEMANARLVANGYAHAYTYPPNVRWSEFLLQLEREARENSLGLWSPDTCDGSD